MAELPEPLRQALIAEHADARHGFGLAEPFTAESFQRSPTCGDEVTLRVLVDDERVAGVSWQGHGCTVSMASASVLTDVVAGLPVASARALVGRFTALVRPGGSAEEDPELGDAVAFAGVGRYPLRARCAGLAWFALDDALQTATAP